ncbi:purine-cytosine permease fcy22 [Colletotrichum tabaci]|uniref:Purine-cytosine permease fcy22 n=1 Tax=Colletotrichum tabaci TaxID=1209068 RepID=A0AAV9T2M4_9PEZI
MSSTTETLSLVLAAAATAAPGATVAESTQSATAAAVALGTAAPQPPPPPPPSLPPSQPAPPPIITLSVPEGVTVVFAERKRTGRVAGAKYKADGTPYKRPGPPPKPPHEKAAYKQRAPVKRVERSYTDQRRREVILFLESHKMACDEDDVRAQRTWNGGREDQQPPTEKGYRWPTLREASEWFKVPERTIHSWWKRRDKIFGRAPRKLTKVEQRRLAEEEDRRRREDEKRRALLEAIGWPAERLPAGGPGAHIASDGGSGGQEEAMESLGGASEGVLMQRERQSEPFGAAGISSSGGDTDSSQSRFIFQGAAARGAESEETLAARDEASGGAR